MMMSNIDTTPILDEEDNSLNLENFSDEVLLNILGYLPKSKRNAVSETNSNFNGLSKDPYLLKDDLKTHFPHVFNALSEDGNEDIDYNKLFMEAELLEYGSFSERQVTLFRAVKQGDVDALKSLEPSLRSREIFTQDFRGRNLLYWALKNQRQTFLDYFYRRAVKTSGFRKRWEKRSLQILCKQQVEADWWGDSSKPLSSFSFNEFLEFDFALLDAVHYEQGETAKSLLSRFPGTPDMMPRKMKKSLEKALRIVLESRQHDVAACILDIIGQELLEEILTDPLYNIRLPLISYMKSEEYQPFLNRFFEQKFTEPLNNPDRNTLEAYTKWLIYSNQSTDKLDELVRTYPDFMSEEIRFSSISGSLLALAIEYDRVEIVEWFLNNGVNNHSVVEANMPATYYSSEKSRLLHCAARFGSLKTLELLLDKGVAVDMSNVSFYRPHDYRDRRPLEIKDSRTALYIAAEYGQVEAIKLLVKRGANTESRQSQNYKGSTPISVAVKNNKPEAVQQLLMLGANPSTSFGFPTLREDIATVRMLLHYGVSPSCYDLKDAARNGYKEIMELLWERFRQENALFNVDGLSTLIHEVRNYSSSLSKTIECIETLIPKLTLEEINARSNVGYPRTLRGVTALHVVCESKNVEIRGLFSSLLDAGADPNLLMETGESPLLLALGNSHGFDAQCVDRLIQVSSPNTINQSMSRDLNMGEKGDTALHLAVRTGKPDLLGALLDQGAKVDVKNARGQKPYELFSDSDADSVKHIKRLKLTEYLQKLAERGEGAYKYSHLPIVGGLFSKQFFIGNINFNEHTTLQKKEAAEALMAYVKDSNNESKNTLAEHYPCLNSGSLRMLFEECVPPDIRDNIRKNVGGELVLNLPQKIQNEDLNEDLSEQRIRINFTPTQF